MFNTEFSPEGTAYMDKVSDQYRTRNGLDRRPVPDFTTAIAGLQVTFTDASSDPDGTIASYAWDFGDGTTDATAAPPAHTYAAAGTYDVQLVVTDNAGVPGTITKPVTVA